jgi:hypothetical protein
MLLAFPQGFFVYEEMTSLEIFDMYFVKIDVSSQYLVQQGGSSPLCSTTTLVLLLNRKACLLVEQDHARQQKSLFRMTTKASMKCHLAN